MRYFLIGLLVCLAAAAQTTCGDLVQIGRIGLHLPAMVAAAVVLSLRNNVSLVIVVLIGFLEDVFSPGRLGIGMAWYLLLGWALLEVQERFDFRPLSRKILATGVFAGLLALCLSATRLVIGEPTSRFLEIGISAVGEGFYTGFVAAPFWFLLSLSESLLVRRQARYEI